MRCHPCLFSPVTTFFADHCHFLLISLGCHPPHGVTPHLFYLSDLVSPLFFVNLPTIFFLRVSHPLEGVARGGPTAVAGDGRLLPPEMLAEIDHPVQKGRLPHCSVSARQRCASVAGYRRTGARLRLLSNDFAVTHYVRTIISSMTELD